MSDKRVADAAPPKPKLQPRPTALSKPFWDAASQGQLLLQVSSRDGRAQFFPRPHGLQAGEPTTWQPATGTGVLLAITLCRVPGPGFEAELPYAMGIVRLTEGPRVLAQIVAPDLQALQVGMAVRLRWDQQRPGPQVYLFEPA